jgi:hypothetical protein
MGNELIEINSLEVTDLNIPSTKLNFMQEKKYREYGNHVLNEIGDMMQKIQDKEHELFVAENKEKIIKEIAARNPILKATLTKVNFRLRAIREHLKNRQIEEDELNNQIECLGVKRDNLVKNWDNKISKNILEVDKIKNDLNKIGTFNTHNLDLRMAKEGEVYEMDLSAEMLIKGEEIEEKLDSLFEKHAKDTIRTSEVIKQMKDRLEEVMLFDEKKLKPLFEQILALKKMVNSKYSNLFLGD